MKKIILDTNFLLIPYSLKIDIFSEIDRIVNEKYQIYVLQGVIHELEKIIKEQKGKHKDAAKVGLALINHKKIPVLDKEQKDLYTSVNSFETVVDDIIVDIADKDTIVATQDKDLKLRLMNKGIKLIYSKNKKLEIKNVL
jgi:rRNA-processing protein FCF1